MISKLKNSLFLILCVSILSACNSKEEKKPDPVPTLKNIEIQVLGLSKFGSVVVGDYRQAVVKIKNNTVDEVFQIPQLTVPFSVIDLQPPCQNGSIAGGQTCSFSVRFQPDTFGDFSATLTVGDSDVNFTGKGLVGGDVAISEDNIDLETFATGEEIFKTVTLTNTGDFTVTFPTFSSHPDISLISNYCGAYIDPKVTCQIRFLIIKREIGSHVDTITMTATSKGSGSSTTNINFASNVVAGQPAGNIAFSGTLPILVADGQQTAVVTSDVIRDEYGNPVTNGTSVRVITQNLELVSPTDTYTTVDGKITFEVRSTTTKGTATISLFAGTAYGVLPLYIRAGQPYGILTLLPYSPNLIADGNTQIGLTFNKIYDRFNNIVEDGTEIPISVTSGGSLSINNVVFTPSVTARTYQGSAQFILKSGTTTGTEIIQVRANPVFDQNNVIVDYAAKGDFQFQYIPGEPFGNIPIVAQREGINAVEDMTLITVGPVTDKTGNIVATNTSLELRIENGTNLSGTGNTLKTNIQGKASFVLTGSGNRGPITVIAKTIKAEGKKEVWAYKDSHLTLQGQKRDDLKNGEGNNHINSGRAYIRYYPSTNNPENFPPINDVWDEIFDYNKLASSDRSYYSIERMNGNPVSTLGTNPGNLFPLEVPSSPTNPLPRFIDYRSEIYVPLFFSPVFYSAGDRIMNAPFWSPTDPVGTFLELCTGPEMNDFGQYLFNAMMFTSKTGLYGCDYNGSIVTTNSPNDRTPEDTKENLYWPSIGFVEEPLGCSFDSAQSPIFNFNLGSSLRNKTISKEIVIHNQNPASVNNLEIVFSGNMSSNWSFTNNDCGTTLASQERCSFFVNFHSLEDSEYEKYATAMQIKSTAVTIDLLLSAEVVDYGELPDDTVGMAVIKNASCYSKLVSFGGYNYEQRPETGNMTIARVSKTTSVFNLRGQVISKFDNQCGMLDTEDACLAGNSCVWKQNEGAEPDAPFFCENAVDLGKYPSRGKAFSPFVAVGKKLYQFSGFDPAGDGDVSFDGLSMFDTENSKWSIVDPEPDLSVDPTNPSKGVPASRYQHGIVFVPETKSLYIYGGLTTSTEQGSIGAPKPLNDMWQLNLFPDPIIESDGYTSAAPLRWKRVCQECIPGLPISSLFTRVERNAEVPGPGYSTPPGVTFMVWNPAHKKVFMYWLGKPYVYWFDPTAQNITFNSVEASSGAVFLGSSQQVSYNPRMGRMFSYLQGNPDVNNGQPYVKPSLNLWDMDINYKTYFKTRFNLGNGAKKWATALTPIIKAYGAAGPDASCGDPCPGVVAYIYNHDRASWSLIGENTAIDDEQLKKQGDLMFSWSDSEAREHISSDGFVDIIVLPKGNPREYNQIHIDSIYLDGTF